MNEEEDTTRHPTTDVMREKRLSGLAYDLAERQLRNGTATSQVQLHFLRMGSSSEQLSREKLENENNLLRTKIDILESQQRSEEKYLEALNAMRKYSGQRTEDVYED